MRVSSCSENYVKMLLLKCEFDRIHKQVPGIRAGSALYFPLAESCISKANMHLVFTDEKRQG